MNKIVIATVVVAFLTYKYASKLGNKMCQLKSFFLLYYHLTLNIRTEYKEI